MFAVSPGMPMARIKPASSFGGTSVGIRADWSINVQRSTPKDREQAPNFRAIERALRTFPELGMQWYLVLDRSSSSQEITVQVESANPLGPEQRNELAGRVGDHVDLAQPAADQLHLAERRRDVLR